MAEANEQTKAADTEKPKDDAAYYKEEAKKAFAARDELKAKIRELEGKTLSDEDRDQFAKLKESQAKAEEDRKRKAGEWDTLRVQLSEKHANEIKERDTRLSTLSTRFKDTVVRAEFGAASDWFSGADTSKTILDVDLGMAALGKYVTVEDTDDAEGYRVVVKRPDGKVIIGDDGNPAPFSDAIGELIQALPNKDRILRGSGKTGSGSSGGSTHAAKPADVIELTQRASAGDKDAIKQLKDRRNAGGGVVFGSAFTTR
jgi:hypothetical protein